MPTTTDFTVPLDDRLLSAGFELSVPFFHLRRDDVYETTVEQSPVDGTWLAVITNLSPDAEGDPVKFRFTHDGTLLSTEGIDEDTARTLYPELLRPADPDPAPTSWSVPTCRHCDLPIRHVGATWVHRDSDSILCNGNIPIATPKD